MIKYSFIIPVKEINNYIREAVPNILKIERSDYEILIFPDRSNSENWPKTKQISSGPGGPAMKRSMAMNHAQGEILIFIDDDAYPKEDFLEKLDKSFKNSDLGAVAGPAITPKDDSFGQKLSGAVFLSGFSGGCAERYVSVGKKKFVDDWPSVNLSVKKVDFENIGGFKSKYWPGEDTLMCLDLINTGKKILYNPELIVFHHRRKGFLKHLKQVGAYGLHRGYFAKKFPKTSLKLKYFIPSLFLVFVVIGLIGSLISKLILNLYIFGWLVYLIGLVIAVWQIRKYEKDWKISFGVVPYILGTHLSYGYNFLKGLCVKNLTSKLR